MQLLILLLAFVSALLLVVGTMYALVADQWHIALRLRRLQGPGAVADPVQALAQPFGDRFLRPLFHATAQRLGRLAPRRLAAVVDRRLVQAGNPWPVSGNEFIGAQFATGIALAAAGTLIAPAPAEPPGIRVLLGVTFFLLGVCLPHSVLSARIAARRVAIVEALPDALDLLVICVEAGLGLDAALQRVIEKGRGPLSHEFQRALAETRLGKPRPQALQDLVDRAGVAELASFVHAVLQAGRLGVPIADVLRAQSDSMRDLKRQRIEERAMKTPLKMIFPMVIFILPVLLMVILGPVAIQVLHLLPGAGAGAG